MSSDLPRRSVLGGIAAIGALAPLPRAWARKTPEKFDLVVIGAGLSGLHAASLLSESGLRVLILEARDRVGGRILSLDDVNGHPEAGGNTMAAGYGRTLDLARSLGLPLVEVSQRRPVGPPLLSVGGQTLTLEQWRNSPLNSFAGAHRALTPGALLRSEVSKANRFTTPEAWCDPGNARFDISMDRFLTDAGYDARQIALIHDTNPSYGRVAHEASLANWLFVDSFSKLQRAAGPQEYAVANGNSRLPEAMAKPLAASIRLNSQVVSVSTSGAGAEIGLADGTRIAAAHVVCSMPLVPLRRIAFDPPLPPDHREAIFKVPQMMVTQTHFEPLAPFWESDGLPPDMWTDTPLGNVQAARGAMAADQITSLTAWGRGNVAAMLDRIGEADARALVLAEFERIRPAARGKLRVAGFKSWQADPYAAGVWPAWAPGQATRLPHSVGKAHGRIHFCGEHTALAERGMEAAFQSGERVALEILAP